MDDQVPEVKVVDKRKNDDGLTPNEYVTLRLTALAQVIGNDEAFTNAIRLIPRPVRRELARQFAYRLLGATRG